MFREDFSKSVGANGKVSGKANFIIAANTTFIAR